MKLSVFGLIKRNYSKFNNPFNLNCLYTSYIHSLLKYVPLIRNNNSIRHSNQLEKIQNNMKSLKTCRITINYIFLYKLLNNEIISIKYNKFKIELKTSTFLIIIYFILHMPPKIHVKSPYLYFNIPWQ